jgi:hypothetical protein
MAIKRVDLLVPWQPRHFVVPEAEIVDELCWARLLNPDPQVLVGYSEDDIHQVCYQTTRSILMGCEKLPHPPNRRLP